MPVLSAATIVAALILSGSPQEAVLPPAPPAPADSVPPLRLGEVYRQVEASHPRVRAARALAEASLARVDQARRPPDPQLQFALMNRDLPGLALNDPLGMNQVQLMQMLPIGGKLGLATTAAQGRAAAADLRAADVAWEQRSGAAMAFYDLLRAERGLVVMRDSRVLVAQAAQVAAAMYANGEGRQADVLRAEVEVARMDEEVVRMEAMRDAMAARLNALLDRPTRAPVRLAGRPLYPATIPPADSLEALAEASRPMLRAGAQEIAAADAAVRLADREIWPDLQLGLAYGQRPMGDGSTERMMSFMLGATIPIWAGSRQTRMKQEMEAMRLMAAADLDAMRADTRGRIASARADADRARRLAALYRTAILPQAEAAAASALAGYRAGRGEFMALLDAQMTLNRFRLELVQLDADEGKALAELEMLTGTPLLDPDSLEPLTAGGSR